MNEMLALVLANLEKVGLGVALFCGAYVANMGLGAWKNVKIESGDFDWKLIGQSLVKFIVLILSLGLLSTVVSILPAYATYVGIEISGETMETIDSMVIIATFMAATIKYIADAITKLKAIFES